LMAGWYGKALRSRRSNRIQLYSQELVEPCWKRHGLHFLFLFGTI
jgi:hypothetical protein